MRPEIAIDASRAAGPVRTGTEWYSYELIRAMSERVDRPELLLYHRDAAHPFSAAPRIRHHVIDMPRLWTHVGLSFAMLRDRPQALFVPAHVIPAVHPRAAVVTVHDLGYLHEPKAHTRQARWMLDLTTRWNAAMARTIIAISGQTREDLIRQYRISRDKVRVIHSGVNHARFFPIDRVAAEATVRAAGISPPYILFLSTVQPRKNLDRLLDAFIALGEPDVQLVVAGKSGWLASEIEDRLVGVASKYNIKRMGYVADDIVPHLYAAAQAFVLPSLYEGFGLGVLEAMASGCPVVVSNTSSLPEIVGDAAALVDPYDVNSIRDGLRRVLNPAERARLRAAGLQQAARFTWDRTACETLDVVEHTRRAGR